MKQKIKLAVGFTRPNLKLLLLDEPTDNLDMVARELFFNFLKENIDEKQLTVLYTSHFFPEVKRVSDYILVMNEGKFIYQPDNTISFEQKTKNFVLQVDNTALAIKLLQNNKISVQQLPDNLLLLKCEAKNDTNDIIDLLREHKIKIYSLKEDDYSEAFHSIFTYQQIKQGQ